MENEKKGKNVLEIILIVLVALSFVLIPLLNQYRQKTISLNLTQLAESQNDRNGTIDITKFDSGDVKTISGTFNDFPDYSLSLTQSVIDNNLSLSGSNDVFGFGFNNYFRFSPIVYGTDIVALEYYLEFKSGLSKSYKLSYYYKPSIQNDGDGDYMRFTPVRRNEFIALNVLPEYDILNISYYVYSNLSAFTDFVNNNEFANNLFNIQSNYLYPVNYFDNVVNKSLVCFINLDYDNVSLLIQNSFNEGKDVGYQDGYNYGFEQGSSNRSVFSLLQSASASISSFLNIEILPNLSLWLLISIPFSIMVILLRLLRGD